MVPKTIARTTFLFGFSISSETKVTFSQATELNTEPTIAAAIPPNKAVPPIAVQLPGISALPSCTPGLEKAFQPVAILPDHCDWETSKAPKIIMPSSARILEDVKTSCKILPFLSPRVLMKVSKTITKIARI